MTDPESDGTLDAATQRRVVRERYARIAANQSGDDRCSTGCGRSDADRGTADATETATRLALADVVSTADGPTEVRTDPDSVAGASSIDWLEELLADAGFERIDVSPTDDSDGIVREWDDEYDVGEFLVAANVTARRPEPSDE